MSSTFKFVEKFFWSLKEEVYLDDFADKCHYVISSGLFAFFSIFIGCLLTVGEPLSCIIPAEFPPQWIKYVQTICFVNGTYIKLDTGNDEDLLNGMDDPANRISIDFYQWVPYLLALQSFTFFLPNYLWRVVQKKSDLDFQYIIGQCSKARTMTGEEREKILTNVSKHFNQVIERSNGLGNFSTLAYFISKLLNLMNVIAQIWFINQVVGLAHTYWGIHIMSTFLGGFNIRQPGQYFPRVGFCTIEHKHYLGQDITREFQCALHVNAYNEKVYLILYFWLLILFSITFLNLIFTAIYYTMPFTRIHFGKRLLGTVVNRNLYPDLHTGMFRTFVFVYLGIDGLLILRFIRDHAGSQMASEIIFALFLAFRKDRQTLNRTQMTFGSPTSSFDSRVGYAYKEVA